MDCKNVGRLTALEPVHCHEPFCELTSVLEGFRIVDREDVSQCVSNDF